MCCTVIGKTGENDCKHLQTDRTIFGKFKEVRSKEKKHL